MIRVPACACVSRVSRVCPGSPRCLFTGTVCTVRSSRASSLTRWGGSGRCSSRGGRGRRRWRRGRYKRRREEVSETPKAPVFQAHARINGGRPSARRDPALTPRSHARSSSRRKAPTDHPRSSTWRHPFSIVRVPGVGTVARTTEMSHEIHNLGHYLGKFW